MCSTANIGFNCNIIIFIDSKENCWEGYSMNLRPLKFTLHHLDALPGIWNAPDHEFC